MHYMYIYKHTRLYTCLCVYVCTYAYICILVGTHDDWKIFNQFYIQFPCTFYRRKLITGRKVCILNVLMLSVMEGPIKCRVSLEWRVFHALTILLCFSHKKTCFRTISTRYSSIHLPSISVHL